MKNIAFYSFAGTFVPTLAALAIKKPKDFVINWYIRIPDLSAELIDSVIAIKQMGFDLPTIKNPYGNFKNFLAQKKLESFYMPFSEKKYELEKINFKYVGKNWVDEIIKDKNDTLILPSIRVESFSLLRKSVGKCQFSFTNTVIR